MWSNPQFFADLVTFTEEILNEKLYKHLRKFSDYQANILVTSWLE